MKIRKSQINALLLGIDDSCLNATPVNINMIRLKPMEKKAYLYAFIINYGKFGDTKYKYGMGYTTIKEMIRHEDIQPVKFHVYTNNYRCTTIEEGE